jgi:hypothetical protein
VLNERLARSLEVIRQQTERQLLPRGAEPGEVAQAYLYLMRGGYTTGQVLIVNGDWGLGDVRLERQQHVKTPIEVVCLVSSRDCLGMARATPNP